MNGKWLAVAVVGFGVGLAIAPRVTSRAGQASPALTPTNTAAASDAAPFSASPIAPAGPARLQVSVAPAGAIVRLNDKVVATRSGKLDAELPPGTYRLQVSDPKNRYEPFERDVGLGAGQTVQQELALKPRFSYVEVSTVPASARVFVAGSEVKRSGGGLLRLELKPGSYEVKTSLEGYDNASRRVSVRDQVGGAAVASAPGDRPLALDLGQTGRLTVTLSKTYVAPAASYQPAASSPPAAPSYQPPPRPAAPSGANPDEF